MNKVPLGSSHPIPMDEIAHSLVPPRRRLLGDEDTCVVQVIK